jgi:hypothetical protein
MKRQLLTMAEMFAVVAVGQTTFAALIAVDINDRTAGDPTSASPANTATGFQPFVLPASPAAPSAAVVTVGAYTFDLSVFDSNGATGGVGAMDDRDRVVPTGGPPTGARAHNEIYDDFFFVGGSAGPTGGLDLKISGGAIQPSTPYLVSIYSFDGIQPGGGSAVPVRTANWLDGNNSDALVFNATFTTTVPPVTRNQYRFTGIALSDATGKLFLKGRRPANIADLSVYVDAIVVHGQVPEPASIALAALVGLALVGWRRRRT